MNLSLGIAARSRTARVSMIGAAWALGSLLALGPGVSFAAGRPVVTCIVDPGHPAASDQGPGTRAIPFRTAAAAIARALAAPPGGNRVVMLAPGIYHEQLAIDYQGAPGETLIIQGTQGSVLDGGRHVNSGDWFPGPGDSWSAPWGAVMVLVDGHELPRTTAVLDSMPAPSWESGPAGTYVNLGGESPGGHDVVFTGAGWIGMTLYSANYLRLSGLTISYYANKGIYMRGGHDSVFENLHVDYCGQYGIDLTGYSVAHDITLDGNVVDHCGSHNINVEYVQNCVIQDNEAFGEAGMPGGVGIHLDWSSGATLQRNRVHHNGDSGMELAYSDGCTATLNLSYANGDHGYNQLYSAGNVFDSDVAWGNAHDGMSLEGGIQGCHIHNCILADNGLGNGHSNLFVADSSDRALVSDDNILWNHTSDPPIKFLGVRYATVFAYATATGQDSHSDGADPRFAAPDSGDFQLLAGSPAIDRGNSSESGWPLTDFAHAARVDDPVAPNLGLGPIPYADRGAYEFQRQGGVGVGDRSSTTLEFSPPRPDPARTELRFTLELPEAAPVRWEVVDLQGRRVASQARALAPAGPVEWRWNLTGATGRRVAPGVYLARVTVAGRSFSRRCVVVR